MTMAKVFRCMEFRILPTQDQKVLIWKTFGCRRWIWNHLLAERIDSNKQLGGTKFINTTPAHFRKDPENAFLKEVDSLALSNTQLNVNQACTRQFARGKTPRFLSKSRQKRRYTTNCVNGNIYIEQGSYTDSFIRLPKLEMVRIRLHRNIPDGWVLKHVTVKETAGGKFFACLTFEVMQEEVPVRTEFEKIEAFDYSMPNLAVSASGQNDVSAEDIRWYRRMEAKIAKEMRRLSHMEYGSENYRKQKHKIGALHEKAANRRKDYLHRLSYTVARNFDAVGVEDINLRAMAQALNFGKSVNDNGFGMFRNFLAYKLHAQGKILVKADRYFPGSQMCSKCKEINPAVRDLSVRSWTCPVCGTYHESRDRNAALNIADEAKNMLNRRACGDSLLILAPSGVLSRKPHPL